MALPSPPYKHSFLTSIQSWHIFRRYRLKRVYRILREYKLHKLRLMILAWLLYGKKIELVLDGSIVDIANVYRARTQKIRRARGKVWWAKRRRKIVRRDNGKVVEFEEVRYEGKKAGGGGCYKSDKTFQCW